MISLNTLLIIFIILFAVIGAMRGWAKELLVSSSVILTIFILTIFENYIPFFKNNVVTQSATTHFWVRIGIMFALVLFAYQTPNIPRFSTSERFMRHYLQDGLLGFVFGALNGYLIFGTFWFFLDAAGYPFASIISAPEAGSALEQTFQGIISMLPPSLLGTPAVYFAVAVAFAFILMAFI